MRRRVHKVVGPTGLHWTVKRLVLPRGMRPLGATEILDVSTPRRMVVDGVPGRVPDAIGAATGPLPLGFVFVPVMLLFVPIVVLCRRARLLPWTIEARAYPWGKRFPAIGLSYAIRGGRESIRALDELAEALARGDGAPTIAGAEKVRESRTVHG